MLFVRTRIFGIRIVSERSRRLVLHAHLSRTRNKNLREKQKNIRERTRTVKTIRDQPKSFGIMFSSLKLS